MSNKSIRIRTTPGAGDKYLKVKLEQDVDQLEILSLKLTQKDIYGSFNADFGVLVGRVIANGGVGIPNAKVSIFIPISEDDKSNSDILAIYPYATPRDKNLNGVRYNLLPRVSVNNPFISNNTYAPKVALGTFPTKEEITTNETFLEVFEKYYKFTTVTNISGDYMIYGAPVGNQTVHMSVDITDIGRFSMNPSSMVTNLGYSPSLFDDSGTKVRFTTDLETAPNIEAQEVAVNIRPFWGDTENFEIGITRQDFKIRALLVGNFVVFGSSMTDSESSVWANGAGGSPEIEDFYLIQGLPNGNAAISIGTKRISEGFKETIFYYPNRVSDADIISGNVDIVKDYAVLTSSEYTRYIEQGQFAYVLSCNRGRKVTDEFGNLVPAPEGSNEGIFTEFRGFMIFELPGVDDLPVDARGELDGRPIRPIRVRYKFPQKAADEEGFTRSAGNATKEGYNEAWRKQHFTFSFGELYSVSRYHNIHFVADYDDRVIDKLNETSTKTVGIIVTDNDWYAQNSEYEFPSNGFTGGGGSAFGAQWLNFCIHFPQMGYVNRDNGDRRTNLQWTSVADRDYYTHSNGQRVAAYVKNTKGMGRSDRSQTTFIRVDRSDAANILQNVSLKGFNSNQLTFSLLGNYANGATTGKGGRMLGIPSNPIDPKFYFYRGFDSADCLEFINRLGFL